MSGYTLFISDLHLSANHPNILQSFKEVLAGPARDADVFYILGDLFDVWIGDDDSSEFSQQIISLLSSFTRESKVPTYFMRGNRDFLVDKLFAEQTGILLLDKQEIIDLYGVKTVLMHGDSLCTLDRGFQLLRFFMHNSLFRKFAYCIPIAWRQRIAAWARRQSKSSNSYKQSSIMDVEQKTVDRVFAVTEVKRMIHGHTHRKTIHQDNRIVLGDWDDGASMLYVYSSGEIELI